MMTRQHANSTRRTIRARGVAKSRRIHGRKRLNPRRIQAARVERERTGFLSRGDVRRVWWAAR
jgi:hypothetical protein